MHRSKRLAILLAVSLFMGSTVGTSAMAAETAEEATSVVTEEDASSEVIEEDTSSQISEEDESEAEVVEETEVTAPDDKEEETEAGQEAASDNGESAGYNGDTKDVQDETKDEEIPEEADLDYQYETGKELLTDETTVEYEADTQVIINEAKSSFSDDQSIGEDYTNATEISVNDELNTYLNYNYAYFKFTPEKDGIYNFSVDVYGPMSVTIWLYDDELNLLAKSSDYRYEIADRLEASKTYYYEVYSAGNCKIQLKETTFFANTAQSYFKPDFGEEITLSINAYSDKPIEYMWYDEDNNLIEGVESADYTFVPEKIGTHEYRCEVTDGVNSATVFFIVELINRVHAEAVCTSFNVNQGEMVTLEVNAYADNGAMPSYKWYTENRLVGGDNEKPKSVLTVYADKTKQYVCYAYINNAISSPNPQPGEIVRIQFYINVNDQPTHIHNLEKTEGNEATCTEDGNIEFWTCSGCGKLYSDADGTTEITEEDTVIKSLGHNWTAWTVTKPATETETGLWEKTCTVCGERVEEEIPMLKGTWMQDRNGWWYDRGDGTYPKDGFEEIKGVTYYFDASGYMKTGWVQDDADWYYFAASGAMVKDNWQQSGSAWYYFGEDGKMLTGLQEINGTSYFFKDSGAMATGWQQIDGDWFFFNAGGAMVKENWQQSGNTWYYFDGEGKMQTGLQEIGGKIYFFKDSGAMVTGWQQIGDDWYYFESSGAAACSKWVGNYYMDETGVMVTNDWVDNHRYYVGADGLWIPGYVESN